MLFYQKVEKFLKCSFLQIVVNFKFKNQASNPVDDSINCALNKSDSSLECNEKTIVRCFGDGNKEQLAQPNLTFGVVNLKNTESSGVISTSNSNAVGEHKNDNNACMTILEVRFPFLYYLEVSSPLYHFFQC